MRYDYHSMLPERAFQPRASGPFAHCLGMTREGGKGGGSAPAPDPNIGIAQKELADLAKQQWATFQTDIWPTMKEQVERQEGRADEQFALDRQIQDKQSAIADEEYARRRDVFRPIEDAQIAEAMKAGGAEDQEKYAALALGDTRLATDRQANMLEMQQRSFGIDPTSGRYQGMMRAGGVDNAAMEAAAATRARQAAEQLGWAKRMDAIGMGAGQFGNQATSTGLALNAGGAAMNAGQTNIGNYGAMSGALNSSAGTAMSGWNSVGTLGVNKYNADVNAYKAQEAAAGQSAAGFGSMAGSLGAAAITAF